MFSLVLLPLLLLAPEQEGWKPPDELLNAKTIYIEAVDPSTAEGQAAWESTVRWRKDLEKQLAKWCKKGGICLTLAGKREEADLITNTETTEYRMNAEGIGGPYEYPDYQSRTTISTQDGRAVFSRGLLVEETLEQLNKEIAGYRKRTRTAEKK